MKISLGQLVSSIDGPNAHLKDGPLTKLANDSSLPVKTLFRVARLWKAAVAEYGLYNETRTSLCNTYGKVEEGSSEYTFDTPELRAQFEADYVSLLETQIDLPGEPLTIADFLPRKIFDAGFLSAQDLIALDWLIQDEQAAAATQPSARSASGQ